MQCYAHATKMSGVIMKVLKNRKSAKFVGGRIMFLVVLVLGTVIKDV